MMAVMLLLDGKSTISFRYISDLELYLILQTGCHLFANCILSVVICLQTERQNAAHGLKFTLGKAYIFDISKLCIY
jgi:hypothetical protein